MRTIGAFACCGFRGHEDKIVSMELERCGEERTFSREYKIEAVKLVTERGVSVAQACRDLDVAESVSRCWLRDVGWGSDCHWSEERPQCRSADVRLSQ
jgi:hypothetical protein